MCNLHKHELISKTGEKTPTMHTCAHAQKACAAVDGAVDCEIKRVIKRDSARCITVNLVRKHDFLTSFVTPACHGVTYPCPGVTPCHGVTPPCVGVTPCHGVTPPSVGVTPCHGVTPPYVGVTPCHGVTPPCVGVTPCHGVTLPSVDVTPCHRVTPPCTVLVLHLVTGLHLLVPVIHL